MCQYADFSINIMSPQATTRLLRRFASSCFIAGNIKAQKEQATGLRSHSELGERAGDGQVFKRDLRGWQDGSVGMNLRSWVGLTLK